MSDAAAHATLTFALTRSPVGAAAQAAAAAQSKIRFDWRGPTS